MNIQRVTLNNQLDTVFVNQRGLNYGTVQIWFKAGSSFENGQDLGVAHFLEHMFFKGSPLRPGAQIAHEVESFGGEINAFTSFDYTCYYINFPKGREIESVDILLDMVANPSFLEEELLPERDVVFEEYRRSLDNPGQFAFMKLQEQCFSGGYAHPILGSEQTIRSFSRDQIINFRKSYYNAHNALLVVGGDFDPSHVSKTIEKHSLPTTGTPSQAQPFQLKKRSSLDIHRRDVHMAQFTLCLEAPELETQEAPIEDLLFNILGQGDSSLLHQDIVFEKGLATKISCSTMFLAKGSCHFLKFYCPVENFNSVLKRIVHVLKGFSRQGAQEKNLSKIKNQYIASKVYEKESLESFSFSLGYGHVQAGDIYADDLFVKRIKKVTAADLASHFSNIFKRSFHANLQLPLDKSEKEFKKPVKDFLVSLEQLSTTKTTLKKKKELIQTGEDLNLVAQNFGPGLEFLHRHNDMTPTFSLHAYFPGGLIYEGKDQHGLYHLLSQTLTQGYKGWTYEKLKTDLEDKAAQLHGFSGRHAYGVTLHGQVKHFDALLEHFFGVLTAPTFLSKSVKTEKENILRVLKHQEKDPIKLCFKEVSRSLFKGHSYQHPTLGDLPSLKKISARSLSETHKANLKSGRVLFSFCGDMERDIVLSKLKNSSKKIRRTKIKKHKLSTIKKFGKMDSFIEIDREQTQLFLGRGAYPMGTIEDLYLGILTSHLSGQSSELFVEVRDRQGLCYTAQPVHFSSLAGGYWGIYMASGHDKSEKAIRTLRKLLTEIGEKGLSHTEFQRIQNMVEGQNLLNIQTNEDYLNIYSIPYYFNFGINYFQEKNRLIQSANFKKFNQFLRKFLSEDLGLVVVGRK